MKIYKNELPPFAKARAKQVCQLTYHISYDGWLRCLMFVGGNRYMSKETEERIKEELFPLIFGEKDNA